jgi:hypothetical protein
VASIVADACFVIVVLGAIMTTRSEAAIKAWDTRRKPTHKAKRSEQASKKALEEWCRANGWKFLFFEGKTGSPRTGIVDAVIARIRPEDADAVEIKLVQLKSGSSGLSGPESARLQKAIAKVSTGWFGALFDGNDLHFVSVISRQATHRKKRVA